MSTAEDAPLIEAILELRWGEVSIGSFQFNDDDQQLFAGKISAVASSSGFSHVEHINPGPNFPGNVSYRFRSSENAWPCYQVGLGIFTVNQIDKGYEWQSFYSAIEKGLEMFDAAGPNKLAAIKDTLVLILRYQDAFVKDNEDENLEDYLSTKFHIEAGLPDSFFNNTYVNNGINAINCQFHIESVKPKGEVILKVASGIISGQPGILLETLNITKASNIFGDKEVTVEDILTWLNEAHDVQKHSFANVVKQGG